MKKLIFVYNADSGKLNALMDSLQKVVNPSSYSCKLCELTYGLVDEKKEWKKFRQSLDVKTDFLHKNEFLKTYASKFGHKFEFPVVLAQTDKGLEVFISKNEFSEIGDLEVLMETIRKRLQLY
ncbi:GTPase [Christiangramia sabulilitoris]|uniref:GTPase n=1 Tax=Christiangramia sabulilitoris TaxID=2583991 RepID=A0A550I3T7_9FLAO|nr:GTPase [Christiangramia sabulilitoris]TRO65635.1 GTPase [Christiangramia sabulilitoris]